MVKDSLVNVDRGVGPWEVWETPDFAESDELLRRPNIVRCSPCQEICPVGVFGFFYCLEVALPREPGEAHEAFRAMLFCQSAGLGVCLA